MCVQPEVLRSFHRHNVRAAGCKVPLVIVYHTRTQLRRFTRGQTEKCASGKLPQKVSIPRLIVCPAIVVSTTFTRLTYTSPLHSHSAERSLMSSGFSPLPPTDEGLVVSGW
ncbi:hypothetical protein J6590_095636 [Homalodisca vitripennis]|nr:hypothetical protein J6590_095636 [Homalodisca vitripennis]